MPASTEDLRRSIEPGSIPFGQRQPLEAQLPQIGAQLGLPSNPLDPLVGGDLPTRPDEVTAGLSVGPGPGPRQAGTPGTRVERLRMVATQARSPVLREMARRALRSTVRTRRGL